MVSTIELQVNGSRFTDALLQTLRATPRPLPDSTFGFQVQRIRYLSASLRHDKPSSYRINQTSAIDVGLGYIWIKGKQAQVAVAVEVEVVTESSIEANMNHLAPPDIVLRGTLLFDFDALAGGKIGSIELVAKLSDLETGVDFPSLPGHDDAQAWAIDQLSAQLALTPMTFDLSYAVPHGLQFENVGLSVGSAGDFLILRIEITGLGNESRWTNFHNGFVESSLAGQDWAVVLLPKDVELTLQTTLWDALAQQLGDAFLSVGVTYAGRGDRATFEITAWVKVPDSAGAVAEAVGDVVGPQSVTIWVTAYLDENGVLLLDVDGSQADDIGSGIQAVIAGMAVLFVPVVGWLVAALLYEVIGEALDQLSAAVVDLAEGFDGLPPGASVEEIDPARFVYRVRIPLQTPAGISGRIAGLAAMADSLALRGSYVALEFTQGDLEIDVTRFAWIAPQVGCGASGEAALRAYDADPVGASTLHAQVDVSTTGTAPVSVDNVVTRQMSPQVSGALSFDRGRPRLPTTINLDLPSSVVTSGGLDEPIVIDVRTSLGVVRCKFDPPPALPTEGEIKVMRSAIKMQLTTCDATVKPDWWLGKNGLVTDWVDHGLDDPDHVSIVTGIQVRVTGGVPGLVLELGREGQPLVAATLGAGGDAMVEHMLVPGEVPEAWLRVPEGIEKTEAYAIAATHVEEGERPPDSSFAVYRIQLTSVGRTHLARATSVVAAQRAGVGHFLVRSGDEQVLMEAGRRSVRPSVTDVWSTPTGMKLGSGDASQRSASGRLSGVGSVLGNGLRGSSKRDSHAVSAWLDQGVWSGDILARTTGHSVEFWQRTGDPVLMPPPGSMG